MGSAIKHHTDLTSMEEYSNPECRSSTVERSITHYSSSHKILLVGEGDFSFSVSLATAFGSAVNMVATSLDLKLWLWLYYSRAPANLQYLEELGCRVMHGVDATTMSQHPLLQGNSFDRIVFNFPHAGFHYKESYISQIWMHQDVVRGFLWNAKEMVAEDGEIHVTHKTSHPFSRWGIEELGSEVGLRLKEKAYFSIYDYPGYENKRGAGNNVDGTFPVGECSTFKFIKFTNYLRNFLY